MHHFCTLATCPEFYFSPVSLRAFELFGAAAIVGIIGSLITFFWPHVTADEDENGE